MAPAKTPTFPATQNDKRTAGATAVTQTPLSIRALRLTLSMGLEDHIRETLSRKLGPAAATIERLTVRFEDINGPKGGIDFLCTAKVSLSAVPSVVVTGTGRTDREAFNAVTEALARAVRTKIDRANAAGRVAPRRETGTDRSKPTAKPTVTKAQVPAAAPTISTAERNVKGKTTKATAKLEDSAQDRPTRKSTRRSANRVKSATKVQAKAAAKRNTPKAKALTANATKNAKAAKPSKAKPSKAKPSKAKRQR